MNKSQITYAVLGLIAFFSIFIMTIAGVSGTDYKAPNEISGGVDSLGLAQKMNDLILVKEQDSIDRDEIISLIKSDFKQKVNTDDNSDAEELGLEIYAGLNRILPLLSGAGENTQYNINIEKLPTDPLFASQNHMGRDYSLRIALTCSNRQGIFSDTAFWYSNDATKIAKSVFDSSYGSRIGVLGVVFSNPDTGGEVTLILNSKDAEQIRPYWSGDETSLRLSDWSSFSTKNTDLIMYEDPKTSISLNPIILSKTGYDYYFEEADSSSLIKDSSGRLLESAYDISTAVSDKNYDKIVSSSKKLLELCNNEKKVFGRLLSQNKGSEDIKNYITGIDYISDAGSDYWYGAVSMDQSVITEGNLYFGQGTDILNSFNENGAVLGVITDILPVVSQNPLKNCYSLNNPVHYKDSSECNDLSVNVKSYRLLSSLSLKDGDIIKEIKAGYGKIFVAVVVDIYHLGYRGGSTSVVTTPLNNDFTLIYEGINYKDKTPDYYIRNVGQVYSQKKLNRLENYESNLIYEIDCPDRFDPESVSVKLNLGSEWGEHIWNFGDSDL